MNTYLDTGHDERISQIRGQLLTELTAGVGAMQRAAVTLEQLRGTQLCDLELVDGRDGRDIAVLVEDSIRYGRAAYTVMHAIIDKETP